MKKNTFLLILIALVTLTTDTLAQKPKPSSDTIVTSSIQNFSDIGPFSIQSDNLGVYKNGTDSVVSRIQGIGDWELDMLSSLTRKAYISFDQPVTSNNPTPPANNYYPVRFLTQCSTNLTTLTSGSTQTCPLIVAINVGTERYSLRFYTANFPGTDNVQWTCNSALNGKCNSWTMQSKAGGNIARVLKITTSKGKTVTSDYGLYNFTFSVGVTNP